MFTFKYQPEKGIPYRKVVVPSGFHRISHTASYFSVTTEHCTTHQSAKLVFWSYETPIAFVSVDRFATDDIRRMYDLYVTLVVNDTHWNVSRTTVRQFTRFLRYIGREESLTDGFSATVLEMLRDTKHAILHEMIDAYHPNACPTCDVWTIRAKSNRLWREIDVINAPVPKGCWITKDSQYA